MPHPSLPSLPREADVVIVGSGYTGMAAALEVARTGKGVVVLESQTLGWGASSRNGGMVSPGMKGTLADLRRRHGPIGEALYRSSVEAYHHLERLVREERIDCDYVRCGRLHLAHCPSGLSALRDGERVYREELGLDARFLPREELEGEIGSPAFWGGLVSDDGGGLHPAKLMAGLARLALAAGAEIHEWTRVVEVEGRGAGLEVRTPRGAVKAPRVLVATDGYTGPPFSQLRRRLVVIGSYLIATERLEPRLAKEISPRGRMFSDSKHFLYYWRLSPDGARVLFGGRASLAPTTVARARDWLYRGLLRVHPQLDGVRVEYAWGGKVALTMDLAPRLGSARGLTYALGYSGRGVAQALWFGTLAGRWMCGDAPPPYTGLPLPRVPLSRASPLLLPVVGLWYKARDLCWDRRRQ